METYDLSKITSADFSKHLDQPIKIYFSETVAADARVVKVTDIDSYSPLERGAFSVVLQTVEDKSHYPQGVYVVDHPENKKLEVFLVPIGPGQNGMKYEAVFS